MSLKVISASDLEGVVTLSESSESRTTNILSKYVDTVKHVWLSDNELISLRDYLNTRFPAEDIGQVVDENQLPLPFNHFDNFVTEIASAPVVEPSIAPPLIRQCINCQHEDLPSNHPTCAPCLADDDHHRPNFVRKGDDKSCKTCEYLVLPISNPRCINCCGTDYYPNYAPRSRVISNL
jgi:hypothetical protein